VHILENEKELISEQPSLNDEKQLTSMTFVDGMTLF